MRRKENRLTDILKCVLLVLLIFGGAAGAATAGNVTATLASNSGNSGSTVNLNFTAKDTSNSTSWFNITFPGGFNVIGAIINLLIDGQPGLPPEWNNTSGLLFINVSSGTTFTHAGTDTYINISNVTLPVIGGASSTYTINVKTSTGVTVPLGYTVRAFLTNISLLGNSTRPGTNATYYLNLTNTGTESDTYTLAVVNSNSASVASLNTSLSQTLNPGESRIFTLNVTNTVSGVFYVNVTATSGAGNINYVNTTTSVISLYPAIPTSYWGNVNVNGILKSSAIITVHGSNGIEVANTISNQNGSYSVLVPWDDLYTIADEGVISGENITFKVDGTAVHSEIVKDSGTNNRLNLTLIGITPPVITIVSPRNIQYNNTSIPLNVTANEAISSWLYSLNGAPNQTFVPNTTVIASQGANTLTVYANDTENSWNMSTVTFSVDSIAPVIILSYPINNTSISIFDRGINGSITDNNDITASLNVNDVSRTWTTKGNFSFIANYKSGLNTITISATDAYNNTNISTTVVNVLSSNETTHDIPANNSTNILANESTGADLALTAGNNPANVTVVINASINASDFNVSSIDTEFVALGLNQQSLVRFVEINATGDVTNLSSVKLTLFYNNLDLDVNGNGIITDVGDIKEDTLNLYWFWDNATGNQEWFPLTDGADLSDKLDRAGRPGPIVSSVERNITGKYISVTMNHFSTYSIAGSLIAATTPGQTYDPGSSGSGGGGGGFSSAENASNIEVIEKYDMQISKDVTTSYYFRHKKNPIMFVNITGKTSPGIITTSVEVLKKSSNLMKTRPEGLVYKNANIWVGTPGFATPQNIKEALITFKVDNAWMSAKGVSASDVVLVKWDGNSWIKLETKVLSKDDASTYFEGKTNAFSSFAITAGKPAGTPEVTEPQVTTPGEPGETPKVTEATPGKKTPGIPAGLTLMVIAGAAYFILRKKEDN